MNRPISKLVSQYLAEGFSVTPYKQAANGQVEAGLMFYGDDNKIHKPIYQGGDVQEAEAIYEMICLFYDGFKLGRKIERNEIAAASQQ